MGAGLPGSPGPRQYGPHLELRPAADIGAVVHRLGAVGAVLLAAPRLDAEQGGQLHVIARVRRSMHLLGLPEQIHQRLSEQGLDLRSRPVVTGDHEAAVMPPKRRVRPW